MSHDPTSAWQILSVKQKVESVKPVDPQSAVPPGHVRFVCVSDTHSKTQFMATPLPAGDVLIHAGDFSSTGKPNEIEKFSEWLGSLHQYKHKVVIAG